MGWTLKLKRWNDHLFEVEVHDRSNDDGIRGIQWCYDLEMDINDVMIVVYKVSWYVEYEITNILEYFCEELRIL